MQTVERDVTLEKITALRGQGLSQRAIAETLSAQGTKVSRSYVQKALSKTAEQKAERPQRVVMGRSVAVAFKDAEGSLLQEGMTAIRPPDTEQGQWTSFPLDSSTWKELGQRMTLPVLMNIAPGVSRAVWDYLRMLDSGHTIRVYKKGGETIDQRGTKALNLFIEQIENNYSSMKAFFQQVFMASLLRGAFCLQLTLGRDKRTPIDIIVPDPDIIRFKAVPDPDRGTVWEPGIIKGGDWISVAGPTFVYVPVDPMPGVPYGRSIIAPSTFPSIFILGLMYDLRRVVAQQGYPRTDVTVKGDMVKVAHDNPSTKDFKEILEGTLADVATQYASLEPDDAYVHSDAIEISKKNGAIDSNVVAGAVGLLQILERMEIRALKTMPLMMGVTDGVSEANANRQWEIFAAGVKSLQHHCETVVSRILTMALQIQGINADVKVKFAEIRSAEMLRDEQVMAARLENAAMAEDRGYMDHDEASLHAVGHAATGTKTETDMKDDSDVLSDEESDAEVDKADEPAVSTDDDVEEPVDDSERNLDMSYRKDWAWFFDEIGDYGPAWQSHHVRPAGKRSMRVVDDVQPDDVSAVVRRWRLDFKGEDEARVLDAEPKGRNDTASAVERWVWIQDDRTYWDLRSGNLLHTSQCRELLDRWYAKVQVRVERLVGRSLGQFVMDRSTWSEQLDIVNENGWEIVRQTSIGSYLLGLGGRATTEDDRSDMEMMLERQHDYWDEFMDEMESSEGELDQIESRIMGYVLMGAAFYERARSRAWMIDLPVTPPVHPRCRCAIEYGRDGEGLYATWHLQGDRPCAECESLAAEYEIVRGGQ